MASDQLGRFREAVDAEGAGTELEHAIAVAEERGIEIFGEALKTAPRGYPRDHPRARLLRHRSMIAGARLGAGPQGIDRGAALHLAREAWNACAELNAWLDTRVGASTLEPTSRYRRG